MKLYNPFKPHIVEFDGWYYVRKLTLIGFQYLDQYEYYWWYDTEHRDKYCRCALDQAKENIKRKPKKPKVVFP